MGTLVILNLPTPSCWALCWLDWASSHSTGGGAVGPYGTRGFLGAPLGSGFIVHSIRRIWGDAIGKGGRGRWGSHAHLERLELAPELGLLLPEALHRSEELLKEGSGVCHPEVGETRKTEKGLARAKPIK